MNASKNSKIYKKKKKTLLIEKLDTLSFRYIAIESASSGLDVHSRIFLAQYILDIQTSS